MAGRQGRRPADLRGRRREDEPVAGRRGRRGRWSSRSSRCTATRERAGARRGPTPRHRTWPRPRRGVRRGPRGAWVRAWSSRRVPGAHGGRAGERRPGDAPAGGLIQARGAPLLSMTPSCTWRSSPTTRTPRTAGCWPPTARGRAGRRPGFSPERVARAARGGGEAAGRGPGHARPLRPRRLGGGGLRDRAVPLHPQGRRAGADRPRRVGGGLPVAGRAGRPTSGRSRRRRARAWPGWSWRCSTRPGHTPGSVCFRTGELLFTRRPGLPGDDRPLRLPELVRGGDGAQPAAVPAAPRRPRRATPATCEPTDRRPRSGRPTRSCPSWPDRRGLGAAPGHPGLPAAARPSGCWRCTTPPHRAARLFGYRYVETADAESTELFERTSGETSDVVRRRCTRSRTAAAAQLTLRPEATAR